MDNMEGLTGRAIDGKHYVADFVLSEQNKANISAWLDNQFETEDYREKNELQVFFDGTDITMELVLGYDGAGRHVIIAMLIDEYSEPITLAEQRMLWETPLNDSVTLTCGTDSYTAKFM